MSSPPPFTIRLAQQQDVPALLEIYKPYILNTPVTFEQTAPAPKQFWQRIQNILEHYLWLVGAFEGEIAGYAYATAHRQRASYQWTKEVSVYVRKSFQRQAWAKRCTPRCSIC